MSKTTKKFGERPESWANWAAYTEGKSPTCATEFELYSDSVIHGTTIDLGPYRIMNLIAGGVRETSLARPVAALRIHHATNANPQPEDAEHGGRHQDELTALISLLLGIRLQASGKTRYFVLRDDDPLGSPRARSEVETPILLPGAWTPIIAHAHRAVDLDELQHLATYPQLSAEQATALMRAARLYQDGLWVSEREPWLSWLLFVSAIETAAQVHKGVGVDLVNLLREFSPNLSAAASKYGEECEREVAKAQVHLLGATKRFLGFLGDFCPEPPTTRPSKYKVEWSAKELRKPLKQIYDFRSRHLHSGEPFPWHVCSAPEPTANKHPVEVQPDHGG